MVNKTPWLGAALFVLFTAACSERSTGSASVPAPGESRTFEGTWSASGSQQILRLERGHKASIVSLTGSLLLTGQGGLGIGFRGEVIGLSDSLSGGVGKCVWTDERGDKIFSDLKGEPLGTGSHVTGTITGGTGRYAGATGAYELQWQYVIASDDGSLSGRAVGLKGRVMLPAAGALPR